MTSVSIACPQCHAALRVKPELIGRRAACPRCQHVFALRPAEAARPGAAPPPAPAASPSRVPAARPAADRGAASAPAPRVAASQPAPPNLNDEILAGFRGPIEHPPRRRSFDVAVAAVAAVMLVFPLLYAGLIVGLAALLMVDFIGRPTTLHGRAASSGWFVYLVIKFVLGVLIFFLIKPMFAPRVARDKPRSLTRQGEPLLFAFVERLCEAVGAPKPARIDVDCQINASASFRRGLRSLAGDDLVLTIGLPLAAGLSLQEFAGVLAHEFGHFAQRTGMRLSYLVRSISMWLTRIVYERDVWDERLRRWARYELRLAVVCYLAMAGVWLTRRVLWVLMMGGHLVSALLLRQMEFDADRYEARLAGSETFAATTRRLYLLGLAAQGAYADLDQFLDEGRLADNLPRLIEANVRQLPAKAIELADEEMTASKTGPLDTHPCPAERIASAAAEAAPGAFHSERPAAALFADFAALCKTATIDLYRQGFGSRFRITDMHSVEALLAKQEGQLEAQKLLKRYTQAAFHPARPLPLPSTWLAEPADPRALIAKLRDARQELARRAPQYCAWLDEWVSTERAGTEILQARAIVRAGLKLKEGLFKLPLKSADDLAGQGRRVAAQRAGLLDRMTQFERTGGERLFAALELLHHPKIAAKTPDAAGQQARASQLLEVAHFLGGRADDLLKLRREYETLGALAGQLDGNEKNQSLLGEIVKQMKVYWQALVDVRTGLSEIQYPFEHAKGPVTVGQFVLPDLPSPDDLAALGGSAGIVDRAFSLYARALAELATAAQAVEQLVGLAPLPEPPQREQAAAGATTSSTSASAAAS